MPGFDGEMRADGQANEIVGVGHGIGFVEIVDAPDEAALDVAPGAEIFDVKIADGEHLRGFSQVGADLRPDLRPAIVGGAKKGKDSSLHVGVLEVEILLDRWVRCAEPVFKLAGGFDDVHSAGNDSGAGLGSQRERAGYEGLVAE